jgi:hypothetical protein
MSYNPATDFIGLLRLVGSAVRSERMPGLDYVVAALARAGEPVSLATIDAWSPEERGEAYLWAIAFVRCASVEHLPSSAP